MKKRNNCDFEERQRRCMLALVRDILSDKTVEEVSFENVHGAIIVKRATPERSYVQAIGFTADFCEHEDYEDEE